MAQPSSAQMQQQQQSAPPPSAYFSAAERSQRSVFVGNIPYDATEEELKEIFSQTGQVMNFRIVFDRESGKPKGYGFCEYQDQETAMSAMRNLNNVEFHGRTLRVDSATGDRNKEEIRQLQMTFGGPQEESPYGPTVEPEKAPEAISRAVASLPPEQMFELMKQMKVCIQNNPNEAKNMLMQNPQLAYALLQAQVVMRIVDPQVAVAMLYRENAPVIPGALPGLPPPAPHIRPPLQFPPMVPGFGMPPPMMPPPMAMPPMGASFMPPIVSRPDPMGMMTGGLTNVTGVGGPPTAAASGDVDYRQSIRSSGNAPSAAAKPPAASASSATAASSSALTDDSEKAQLIMQVLQLTDEQIAVLPPDQRQSVMILKEQLKASHGQI